ncbi:MAG: hypothetical protein N3D18_05640 [Roseococcus sp.]|nr:hypothetical protein [Roseococcus sp.]
MSLPDPILFDPVRFPGETEEEPWPPPAFDFAAPWLREPDLAFERGPDGQIIFVRRCESLRLVLDVETAHSALDLVPGSRDFRLLRLIPSALRLVEVVVPGDPVPPTLRGEPPPAPREHHVYAATTALVAALERDAGRAGEAYMAALRRTPPGPHMFEIAAARCVTDERLELERVARLARALQRLARAHAGVLAAHAEQPDYPGMERMVQATARVLLREAGWSGDLLGHAVRQVCPLASIPRETAEGLRRAAAAELEGQTSFAALEAHVERQAQLRERLVELGLFWRRLAAAWASVHPETTDRREVEALCRNMIRRLQLKSLYAPP